MPRRPPAKRAKVEEIETTPLADYWLADAASASKRDEKQGTRVWDDGAFTDGEDDAPPKSARAQRGGGARRRVRQLLEGLEEGILGPHSLVRCEAYRGEDGLCETQPFRLKVHPDAAFVCDLHAHLCDAEIIGLLGGWRDPANNCVHVQAHFPCKALKRDDDGATDVEMDPVSEFQVPEVIRAQDLEVVGWYHSHPRFAAEPSVTDIENQDNYQALFRDDTAAPPPFIGLIVGTYDTANESSQSIMRYFHVAPPPPDMAVHQVVPLGLRATVRTSRKGDAHKPRRVSAPPPPPAKEAPFAFAGLRLSCACCKGPGPCEQPAPPGPRAVPLAKLPVVPPPPAALAAPAPPPAALAAPAPPPAASLLAQRRRVPDAPGASTVLHERGGGGGPDDDASGEAEPPAAPFPGFESLQRPAPDAPAPAAPAPAPRRTAPMSFGAPSRAAPKTESLARLPPPAAAAPKVEALQRMPPPTAAEHSITVPRPRDAAPAAQAAVQFVLPPAAQPPAPTALAVPSPAPSAWPPLLATAREAPAPSTEALQRRVADLEGKLAAPPPARAALPSLPSQLQPAAKKPRTKKPRAAPWPEAADALAKAKAARGGKGACCEVRRVGGSWQRFASQSAAAGKFPGLTSIQISALVNESRDGKLRVRSEAVRGTYEARDYAGDDFEAVGPTVLAVPSPLLSDAFGAPLPALSASLPASLPASTRAPDPLAANPPLPAPTRALTRSPLEATRKSSRPPKARTFGDEGAAGPTAPPDPKAPPEPLFPSLPRKAGERDRTKPAAVIIRDHTGRIPCPAGCGRTFTHGPAAVQHGKSCGKPGKGFGATRPAAARKPASAPRRPRGPPPPRPPPPEPRPPTADEKRAAAAAELATAAAAVLRAGLVKLGATNDLDLASVRELLWERLRARQPSELAGAPRRPWTLDATSLLLDGVEGDARLTFHHTQA